jgi:hypothetical protein
MRTVIVWNSGPLPYLAVTTAVVALTGVCYGFEKAGITRGYGALFWIVVVASALYLGLRPGIYAAVTSAFTFHYFFVPPLGTVVPDAALLLIVSSMLLVAYIAAHQPAQKTLVLLFWAEADSGDYWRDVANGDKRGDAFLKGLHGDKQTHVLGLMVRDMIALQRFAGAEAAFFHRISCDLIKPRSIRVITAQDDAKDLDIEPGVVEVQDHVVGRAVGDEQPRFNILP